VAHYHAIPLGEGNPWHSGRKRDALDAKGERRVPTLGITPLGFRPAIASSAMCHESGRAFWGRIVGDATGDCLFLFDTVRWVTLEFGVPQVVGESTVGQIWGDDMEEQARAGDPGLSVRGYSAVAMQLSGIIVLFVGSCPYWISREVPEWQKYFLFGVCVTLIGIDVVAGFRSDLSIHAVVRMLGNPARQARVNYGQYLSIVATGDVLVLFVLVALTGGVTDSSFAPLLLLIPVLAIMLGAPSIRSLLALSSACFVLLVLMKIPQVQSMLTQLIGPYSWLLSFQSSSIRGAFEFSTILNYCVTIWATYVQYESLRRA
jgi:hypothetical protein